MSGGQQASNPPSPAQSTMSTSTTTTTSTTAATTAAALQGTITTTGSSSFSINSAASNNVSLSVEDFNFPSHLISIQDRKDEALTVLKTELIAALNEQVKSLEDDRWMFERPRSRINLMSRPGGSLATKSSQLSKHWSSSIPK